MCGGRGARCSYVCIVGRPDTCVWISIEIRAGSVHQSVCPRYLVAVPTGVAVNLERSTVLRVVAVPCINRNIIQKMFKISRVALKMSTLANMK